MRNKNILRCVQCGMTILTQAKDRRCFKCESEMVLIKKKNGNKRS